MNPFNEIVVLGDVVSETMANVNGYRTDPSLLTTHAGSISRSSM